MKEITFFIALAATLCGNLSAQDTVVSGYPQNNYFYTNHEWVHGNGILSGATHLGGSGDHMEMARAYHTSSPLQVIGLTIMLELGDVLRNDPNAIIQDTTMDSTYCDVRLYKCIGDSLHVVNECRVHMRDTPVSYMQELTQTNIGSGPNPIVKSVYECLFDTPIVVTDSFFVGLAPNNDCGTTFDANLNRYVYPHRYYVTVTHFRGNEDNDWLKVPIVAAYRRAPGNSCGFTPGSWRIERLYNPDYYFMFAIVDTSVTPIDTTVTPIDTTVTPVDTTVTPIDTTTTGVSRVDMVGRYVSVSPNPAGDRATVLSSFGLTGIEAYDPQGRQLYTAPATGLRTTLDVSAWPRGTALLHIHTPVGTTVKKLLLR